MTDWDCNPKDAQVHHSNPYEKKTFIANKDCTLHVDNAGYKYIRWFESDLLDVTLYDYELEEMLNRVKQYKGE